MNAMQQPLIMPIIVNQDGRASGGYPSGGGGGIELSDVHKLKDLISQAV